MLPPTTKGIPTLLTRLPRSATLDFFTKEEGDVQMISDDDATEGIGHRYPKSKKKIGKKEEYPRFFGFSYMVAQDHVPRGRLCFDKSP